ncbi:hypothetical protein ACXZ9C_11520 [Streptococcus agalactiae]
MASRCVGGGRRRVASSRGVVVVRGVGWSRGVACASRRRQSSSSWRRGRGVAVGSSSLRRGVVVVVVVASSSSRGVVVGRVVSVWLGGVVASWSSRRVASRGVAWRQLSQSSWLSVVRRSVVVEWLVAGRASASRRRRGVSVVVVA